MRASLQYCQHHFVLQSNTWFEMHILNSQHLCLWLPQCQVKSGSVKIRILSPNVIKPHPCCSDKAEQSCSWVLLISTFPCPLGKCGGVGGIPLLRLRPRLVFMLPRPDHPAAGAALHQAFCGRCLHFPHPQEPEERLSEEDSVHTDLHPSLQPRPPQAPQNRRSPKL